MLLSLFSIKEATHLEEIQVNPSIDDFVTAPPTPAAPVAQCLRAIVTRTMQVLMIGVRWQLQPLSTVDRIVSMLVSRSCGGEASVMGPCPIAAPSGWL